MNVQGQDRRFIHTFGANAEFSTEDIPLDEGCKVLYLGGYFIMDRVRADDLAPGFQEPGQQVVAVLAADPAAHDGS